MPELELVVPVATFVIGIACGLLRPQVSRFLARNHCPDGGEHQFIHLRGAYGYCAYCPARKRFLNG